MCVDLEIGESRALSPGLIVERRSFIATVTALIAATMTGQSVAFAKELARSKLTYEEFLLLAKPLAASLVGDTSLSGQDRYLLSLAATAKRLDRVPIPELRDSGQGATAGTYIGFNPGGEPFNVLHWKLDPGARIRPHAHTYGNVVTLGLDGEAEVENFELIGERDFETQDAFKVKRTNAQRLRKGDVNLVSLERNYIHGFTAGRSGARGLDITTRLKSRMPTPYLILGDKVGKGGLANGRWSIDDPLPA